MTSISDPVRGPQTPARTSPEPPTDLRPGVHADRHPGRLAAVMADGSAGLTYRQLEDRSQRLASAIAGRGLGPGDRVAILLDNHPSYFVAAWAAQRAGVAYTPVNWHLTAEETAYIVADSGARALISCAGLLPLAEPAAASSAVTWRLLVDGIADGWETLDDAVGNAPVTDTVDRVEGQWMFYSSGTTGRPKGIVRPAATAPYGSGTPIDSLLGGHYGFDSDTVYLCPAPLYHAAPLGWSMGTQRRGGTVVVLESFDPVRVLEAVERHRVTHAQFVPTMFIRLLKQPAEVRAGYDLSSLEVVVHAAAPCPPEVKRQMLDWWGPIIHEYYAGSEGTGFVAIGPDEWLTHPGSVGRSKRGPVHILDDDGHRVASGSDGMVWFEGGGRFDYHRDPAKTRAAFNPEGWSTLGDIGHLDPDGYLYLTDRANDLILTGGVNVYPQEVERVLLLHPQVLDAGVVGAPDSDLGERAVAFVELTDGVTGDEQLEQQLVAHLRAHLASVKCPRTVTFLDQLPRLPTGKLLRRRLRDLLPRVAGSTDPVA
ncbi:MAG TPA: AMP-binding protein [Acidimicrobiales bacterium]|nr:AMP-binding protein [Acidimicrobiales bacterium]